jgi:hypothetical protein
MAVTRKVEDFHAPGFIERSKGENKVFGIISNRGNAGSTEITRI